MGFVYKQSDKPITGRVFGGVFIRVVFLVVSLGLLGSALAFVIASQQRTQQMEMRKALQYSEAGLIAALDQIQTTPSWMEGFPRSAYEEGWYKVALSRNEAASPIRITITAIGGYGNMRRSHICSLVLAVSDSGDSAWVQESIRQE